MIDALIGIGGLKPEEVAFFTERDSYGDAGFNLGLTALERHGLRIENCFACRLRAQHARRRRRSGEPLDG